MFGTFRRHQNWIWIIVVVIVIPSFLYFFLPSVGDGGQYTSIGEEPYQINGKPVTIGGKAITAKELRDALSETLLAYFIRSGGREWPKVDERLKQEAIFRVFLVHRLKDLNIEVSDKAIAQMARDRLGNYPFANFERDVLRPQGITTEDFERFSKHEAGIQQLVSVAALDAKLMTEDEAEFIYRKENQEVISEAAVFWTTNFLDKVKVDPTAIGEFYTNAMARYRIPERVQVNYLEFAATNFATEVEKQIAEMTNLNARIEEYYYQQGTNTFKDTNDVVLSAEAAKTKIKEDMRHDLGLRAAHRKANELGNQLMSLPNPNQMGNLEKLAQAEGFEVKTSPPFDRIKGLEESGLPAAFQQAAFNLTTNEPIAFNPVRGKDAVYLVSYKNTVPSELPALDSIREKVAADYKEFEASKLARSAGTNFYSVVTNGLAHNKNFREIAAEEKATVVTLPAFAPGTQTLTNLDERLELRRVQTLVSEMEPGTVSAFTPTRDGGFVLFLRDRLPIDETKMKKEMPDLISRLRQYRQTEAFNQWFGRQAQQMALIIPAAEEPAGRRPPGGPASRPPQ